MTDQKRRLAAQIGRRIKARRRQLGVSPEQFCKRLNITSAALRGYESGTYIPGGYAVLVLAAKFGESADWVLCRKVAA